MEKRMNKIDKTVWKETKYIAVMTAVLSILMQAIFLILGAWSVSVLLGNLWTGVFAVLNFLLMGVSVQKALEKDQKDAKKLMQASQNLRNFGVFVVVAAGVLIPYFHTAAVIVPVFFPRIAVSLRMFRKKEEGSVIEK